MAENETNSQSDFMIEKIKERPINKRKLILRTLTTVLLAIIFGLVACFTFLALEPVLSRWMNPKEELPKVYFPEEKEEMSPEEMLSENIPSNESGNDMDPDSTVLEEDTIQDILGRVNLDIGSYRQLYSALNEYTRTSLQKSVVTLTGISSRVDWLNDISESTNRSSGVIIANNTKELLILTDYKPLERADKIKVTFYNGVETFAEFRRKDPTTGLAVVTIPLEVLKEQAPDLLENNIRLATMGSSGYSALLGAPVIAIGSPMGSSGSVGYGMITSISGQASEADVNYRILQTDIIGSPNASGVLFNLSGEYIGIITNDHSLPGMDNQITAYGISDLSKRMEKLSNDEPFAYAGIVGTSVSLGAHEELNVPYGAYVKEVKMNSPAMRAGIRQGDVITELDDHLIGTYSDYTLFLSLQEPNTVVTVRVMRQVHNEYKEMKLELTLGELN